MKIDMRTKRTKKALKNAMYELLLKQSYEKISVTDLCELAEVNRVTFYTHYNDKSELLNELLEEISKSVEEENAKFMRENKLDDPLKDYAMMVSNSIYHVCVKNRHVISSLNKQQSVILLSAFDQIMVKRGIETLDKLKGEIKLNFPPEFIIKFLLGGISKITYEWAIKNNSMNEQEFFDNVYNLLYQLYKSNILFTV